MIRLEPRDEVLTVSFLDEIRDEICLVSVVEGGNGESELVRKLEAVRTWISSRMV